MLLESVVSMYVLLIGVLVFCGLTVFAKKVGLQAEFRGAAYQIANQQVEAVRSTSFDNLKTVTDLPFDIPQAVIDSMPGKSNAKYDMQGLYSVSAVNNTVRQISVRVQWRNASTPEGRTAPWSNIELTTMVAKPGSVTAGAITTP